jgi:imidazolonepropionase-like amidohydrolase
LLFALLPGIDASLPERMLTYQAARCVREGVSRDDALRAITLNPARILGLADRLGSLEPGKEAYLAVYSGDPLDFSSIVEKVFIEGILAYERERDVRMQRLTTPAAADAPGEKK